MIFVSYKKQFCLIALLLQVLAFESRIIEYVNEDIENNSDSIEQPIDSINNGANSILEKLTDDLSYNGDTTRALFRPKETITDSFIIKKFKKSYDVPRLDFLKAKFMQYNKRMPNINTKNNAYNYYEFCKNIDCNLSMNESKLGQVTRLWKAAVIQHCCLKGHINNGTKIFDVLHK